MQTDCSLTFNHLNKTIMKKLLLMLAVLVGFTFGSCKKETEVQPKVQKMMPIDPKKDMSGWD